MKKNVVLIGSIIGLLTIFAGAFLPFFSWWEMRTVTNIVFYREIHEIHVGKFLSPFGNVTFTSDWEATFQIFLSYGGFFMIMIAILIIIANISIYIGSLKDKKLISIIGASVVLLCLVVFPIVLGIYRIFPEINNIMYIEGFFPDASPLWDPIETLSYPELYTTNYSWRLGNGYLITFVGCITSFVGLALKDTQKIDTQTKDISYWETSPQEINEGENDENNS